MEMFIVAVLVGFLAYFSSIKVLLGIIIYMIFAQSAKW